MHDLLTDQRFLWQGARNFVHARPAARAGAHLAAAPRACAASATSTTSCEAPAMKRLRRRGSPLRQPPTIGAADDPLWYKDAVIYQLHVKAFFDSNDDGIGDFRGLTAKLDYVQDLGVNTIWLLPFYPSPLRDDGYDIADYHDVHPPYGTLADFRADAARGAPARPARDHRAGHQPHLRPAPVVPGRAPRAAGLAQARLLRLERHRPASTRARASSSPTPRRRTGPGTRSPRPYYWHRFFSHQPDLNFDNPHVLKAVVRDACASGSTWASTASGSTRFPTWSSATAPATRTCPRRTR